MPVRMTRRDPARTPQTILSAAAEEFAAKGYDGARIDAVAARSGFNKRMIYEHFGNKDGLYAAVIDETYCGIREYEATLHLERLAPRAAIEALVEHTFHYYIAHPEFIRLLNDENLREAVHVRQSERIAALRPTLVGRIAEVLDRGVASGDFRAGVDPALLYICIASLSYFYLSNAATLSAFLKVDVRDAGVSSVQLDMAKRAALGCIRAD